MSKRVNVFNKLVMELKTKFLELSDVPDEDQDYVKSLPIVKSVKELEDWFDTIDVKHIIEHNTDEFPEHPVFWAYISKIYAVGFKNKKLMNEFITLYDKMNVTAATQQKQQLPQAINNVLPALSQMVQGGGINKIANSKIFKNLQKTIEEQMENDPEFQSEVESLAKNFGFK